MKTCYKHKDVHPGKEIKHEENEYQTCCHRHDWSVHAFGLLHPGRIWRNHPGRRRSCHQNSGLDAVFHRLLGQRRMPVLRRLAAGQHDSFCQRRSQMHPAPQAYRPGCFGQTSLQLNTKKEPSQYGTALFFIQTDFLCAMLQAAHLHH